ncbi:uncharacterized protein KZ484_008271 [Pholidichthys leucotaenia]
MKAQWWSFVWGLLCIPSEVIMLSSWTASQSPSSISSVRANMSAEITCTTSLTSPMGLYLMRHFHDTKQLVYLNLKEGKVTKNTTHAIFQGRLSVTPAKQKLRGQGFTFRLSLLRLDDVDVYYCEWIHVDMGSKKNMASNGTVLIIREFVPQKQCSNRTPDITLISLCTVAFFAITFLVIGALIWRCKQFKDDFRPAIPPPPLPPRPNRPRFAGRLDLDMHCHYLTTSASMDFREIL